jgi:septal ring-binding cell division protein DamX
MTNKISQDKFDEMDELALSLQKQIKDLDNIPEFDDNDLDDNIEDSLAEDIYDNSSNQSDLLDSETLKHQLQNQLSEQSNNNLQHPLLRLHFLIPLIISLFFVISLATYWLVNSISTNTDKNELENSQKMALSLPEKPSSLLIDDPEIVEAKISEKPQISEVKASDNKKKIPDLNSSEQTTLSSTNELPAVKKDKSKTIKKIPLVYIEDQITNPDAAEKNLPIVLHTNKIQPVSNQTPSADPINKEIELIQSTSNKPVQVEFEHDLKNKPDSKTEAEVPNKIGTEFIPVVSKIMPSPVIGNDKRQWIDIKGRHFTTETVLVLQWPVQSKTPVKTQSKQFSLTTTNSQLKFLDENHLRLHINTGIKPRIWQLTLNNKDKKSINYQFKVVKPFTPTKQQIKVHKETAKESTKVSTNKLNNSLNHLKNQPDSNFTLQLLGSSNYQAIQTVLNKHKNYKLLFWYQSKRSGKDWYTISYGSYTTKDKALQAHKKLPKSLKSAKPWVRNLKAVKQQLLNKSAIEKSLLIKKSSANKKPLSPANNNQLVVMNSSINAILADKWTFQLISLSNEKGMKEYIQRNKLGKNAKYFKRHVNGDDRYTLIYGVYQSKKQAEAAVKALPYIIRQGKPWIKQYKDIHKLML